MKKVLGLVISERKLGNSELLVKDIMNAVPDPCQHELIRLTELNLKPCKACYRCLQPGKSCRLEDDFSFVLNKIQEADALIIGVPVYILGPHAYLKIITDRILGVGNFVNYTRGKPCAVVMSYGVQGWTGYTKTAALVLPRFLQMKIIDFWQVHAALPGEGMLNPQTQEYARNLGSKLFGAEEFTKGPRECFQCGSDLFRILDDGKMECPICGAQGRVRPDNTLDFTETTIFRFSQKAMQEHFGVWLVDMKERFLREKDKLKEAQKPYSSLDWWIKPNK